ncbi:DUF4148 domain-containing protein [Variovorax sp. GT1P44]|uniref:DUF4148 domain-containing protein n=1 Tax=Variovorax sp. GT1P44 TaxID=3443742 RepID=UPI003F45182A
MRTFEPTLAPQTGSSQKTTRRWNFARATSTLLLLAALGAAAHADGGMTRAQVKAELAEAMRTGNMLAAGESGLTLRELNPQRYPAPVVALGKSRAEVRTELANAIRTGDIMASDESGLRVNEEFPQRFPAQVVAAGKSRAEVKSELAEAIRTGDILANDESGLRLNEELPRHYAKARAAQAGSPRLMTAEAPSAAGRAAQ